MLTGARWLQTLSVGALGVGGGAYAVTAMLMATSLTMPLIAGAGLKIIYDLVLWQACRHVRPPEEREAKTS